MTDVGAARRQLCMMRYNSILTVKGVWHIWLWFVIDSLCEVLITVVDVPHPMANAVNEDLFMDSDIKIEHS